MSDATPSSSDPIAQSKPRKKRRFSIALIVCLGCLAASIVSFLVAGSMVEEFLVAAIFAWVPLLIGLGLLLVAFVLGLVGLVAFIRRPSGGSVVLTTLCVAGGAGCRGHVGGR